MISLWPHAPPHWTFEPGVYIVTAGVLKKAHLLDTEQKRDVALHHLSACSSEFGWQLQAWAIMSNHYHWVGRSDCPASLSRFIRKFHANSARDLNKLDNTEGRRVWFQFRDTHITNEKSWLARLRYVHANPAHHGITNNPEDYRWCSAAWLEKTASKSFRQTLANFPIDSVSVPDAF